MKKRILFILLGFMIFLVNGCSEVNIEELLNDEDVQQKIYEYIENIEFNVTSYEINGTTYYHIDPKVSGGWEYRNSSSGPVLVKYLETGGGENFTRD